MQQLQASTPLLPDVGHPLGAPAWRRASASAAPSAQQTCQACHQEPAGQRAACTCRPVKQDHARCNKQRRGPPSCADVNDCLQATPSRHFAQAMQSRQTASSSPSLKQAAAAQQQVQKAGGPQAAGSADTGGCKGRAHPAVAHSQLAALEQRLQLVLALHARHLQALVVLHTQQARHVHVQRGQVLLCGQRQCGCVNTQGQARG